MTDKEIIIDGVDVSGCQHFWNYYKMKLCKINFENNYFSNGVPLAEKCEKHKDCYYKQLARLQAQYNEVVAQNKSLQKYVRELEVKYFEVLKKSKQGLDAYEYCIQELEQENEKLKGNVNNGN